MRTIGSVPFLLDPIFPSCLGCYRGSVHGCSPLCPYLGHLTSRRPAGAQEHYVHSPLQGYSAVSRCMTSYQSMQDFSRTVIHSTKFHLPSQQLDRYIPGLHILSFNFSFDVSMLKHLCKFRYLCYFPSHFNSLLFHLC